MDDLLNRYRFFPRAFAIFYMYWMGITINWGMTIEMSNAQAAFVASVITGGAAYFKFYTESGAKK